MKKSLSNSLLLWVLPGFIAGIVFLSIALVTAAMSTHLWAMPDAIALTVGLAAPAGYGFALVPVLVGIIMHLAFSIGLGILFTTFARWRHLRGWMLVVAAVLFIMLETATSLWLVLHTLLPATTFSYFLGAVPLWGSILGRDMYGLVLGLLVNHFASWQSQKSSLRLPKQSIA